MEKVITWLIAILISAILSVVVGLLLAFPIMWLWNAFFPVVCGFQVITWWQAYILSVFMYLVSPDGSRS